MKKIRGSTLAKVTAIFLLLALALACAGCLLSAAFLYELGAYRPGGAENGQEALLNRLGTDRLRVTAHMAADRLAVDPLAKEQRRFDFYYADDFLYVLTDENGRTLVDQLGGGESLWSGSYTLRYTAECLDQSEDFWHVLVAVIDSDGLTRSFAEYNFSNGFSPDGDVYYVYGNVAESTPSPRPSVAMPEISETPEADEAAAVPETDRADNTSRPLDEVSGETVAHTYTLTGYLTAPLDEEDSFLLSLYSALLPFRVTLLWAGLGALVLCLLLFVFLMCAAGHRDRSDAVTPNFSDKVPADLFALVVGGGAVMLAFFGVQIIGECFNYNRTDPFLAALGVGLILAGAALALWLCMSFAARLKLGTVIKSCLCWKLLVLCWRVLKAVFRCLARLWRRFWRAVGIFLRNIPLLWKAILFVGVLLLVEFIVIMSTDYDLGVEVFLWFLESVVLSLAFFYAILCLRRLQKGLREMAGGNTDFRVSTEHLHGDFLASAEDLNSVQVGIARAVNERMKSERFKTELITNVSHDIKTPLTSIINYVDLLGKEEPENEQMREYIEVLSRQSARLKKLIEDLIEASKASSGALSVNLERCDLGVLLDQTAGEYGEKLLANGLELLLKKPEEPVEVMADRRHIWRIFDNLMNNVCKYAQPGTRVYLNLEKEGGKAVVTFRNISSRPLNISGDELMERFVRGDSSRNTEGSGLGLSIARSLAQLQHSDLELTVDGDLFKVTLRFDAV